MRSSNRNRLTTKQGMRRHKVSIDSILRRIFLKRLIDDIYQESPILKALRLNQNKAGGWRR